MIKTILFDADGVVLIAEPFSSQLAHQYNLPPQAINEFFNNDFLDCLIDTKDLQEELAKRASHWGWRGSSEQLLNYWFAQENKIETGLVDYIKDLRAEGYTCYCATNQEKYRTVFVREKMGFDTIFNGIFSSSTLGFRKPDPRFFETVLNQLQIKNPQEILFWDDKLENIQAARSSGIQAELYTAFQDFKLKMVPYLFH